MYGNYVNQHWGSDLQQVPWNDEEEFNINKGHILRNHEFGSIKSSYNFPVNDLTYKNISDHLFTN